MLRNAYLSSYAVIQRSVVTFDLKGAVTP